jgi:RND superfamily putative drug exporter
VTASTLRSVGFTERLARWCSVHPRRTLAFWGAVIVAALASLVFVMAGLSSEGRVAGNPHSRQADELIARTFPPDPRRLVSDIIVVRSSRYSVRDRPFYTFHHRAHQAAIRSGVVLNATSFFNTHDPSLVSRDGHATIVPLYVKTDRQIEPIVRLVERGDRSPDFAVSMTGEHTMNRDFNVLSQHDLKNGELRIGLPAALIVLLLVFGAVVAGLVPLLMAIISIVVSLGLVAVLSQPFSLSVFIVHMLTGMGLALGIDYSLFVISRYREERDGGREPLDAIGAAGARASRAVLFSGSAFVIAMFGMLLIRSSVMRSLALGAILVGIVSVIAALTLLPALLGLLQDRVDGWRLPLVSRASIRRGAQESGFWRAIVDRVLRRPALSLSVAVALLLAVASPVFDLHVGTDQVSTLPSSFVSKRGLIALQRDFPEATTAPVQIAIDRVTDRNELAAVRHVASALASDPRFGPPREQRARDVVLLTAPVRGDPNSNAAITAVRDLRVNVVDPAFARTAAVAHVGGTSAEDGEYFDAVTNPAPWVFAFVLGFTFILLTLVFRSIVVAGTAVLLNLLSVGAAYGLLVLVFEKGFAAGILGFQQVGTVDAWVPLFLFSVLFGLSMDYQVFLLSRIKEHYDRSDDTTDAVRFGVTTTARIITGAALIIVAVFVGFATGDLVMFQQMGFGVAVALLIDATIIRSVILPSAMELLGRWNWYLPSWLEWLPSFDAEGEARSRTLSLGPPKPSN